MQQEYNSNLNAMSTSQYDFEMSEPYDFDSFNDNKTILDNNLSKSKRQAVSYRRVADRRRQPSKKFRHSNVDPSEYSNNPFIDEFLGGALSVPDHSSVSNFKSESLTSFNTTTKRHFDDKFEPTYNNNNNNIVDSLPPQPSKSITRGGGLSRKDKDPSRYNTVCIVDNLLNEKLNEFKLKEEKKANLANSFKKADHQQKKDFNNNNIGNNSTQLLKVPSLNKSTNDFSSVYKPSPTVDKQINDTNSIEQQKFDDLKQSTDSNKPPKSTFAVSIDQINNEMGKLRLVTKPAPKIIHFNSNDGPSSPTTPVPSTTTVAHTPSTRTFNFTEKQLKKDDSKPLSAVNNRETPTNSSQQKNSFESVKLRSNIVHKQNIAQLSSSQNGENTENLIPKRPKTMTPDNLDSLKTNSDNLKTVISISYNDNRKSEIPTTRSTSKQSVLVDSNPNTKPAQNTSISKSNSVVNTKPRAQSPTDGNSDIPKWKLDLMNRRKNTSFMTTSALENAELNNKTVGNEKSTSITFQPIPSTPVINSPTSTTGGQIISNKSTNVSNVITPTSVTTGVNNTNKTFINTVTYNFSPKITQVTSSTPSDITKLTQTQNKQPKIYELSIEHQPPIQQKQTPKTNTSTTTTTTITVAPPSNITKPSVKVSPTSNAYDSSIPEWKRALIEKKKQQKTVA